MRRTWNVRMHHEFISRLPATVPLKIPKQRLIERTETIEINCMSNNKPFRNFSFLEFSQSMFKISSVQFQISTVVTHINAKSWPRKWWSIRDLDKETRFHRLFPFIVKILFGQSSSSRMGQKRKKDVYVRKTSMEGRFRRGLLPNHFHPLCLRTDWSLNEQSFESSASARD